MTLDELEKECRFHLDDLHPQFVDDLDSRLARALLAMPPVVRAAHAERDDHDWKCACRLCTAIDTLRREMGGGS